MRIQWSNLLCLAIPVSMSFNSWNQTPFGFFCTYFNCFLFLRKVNQHLLIFLFLGLTKNKWKKLPKITKKGVGTYFLPVWISRQEKLINDTVKVLNLNRFSPCVLYCIYLNAWVGNLKSWTWTPQNTCTDTLGVFDLCFQIIIFSF